LLNQLEVKNLFNILKNLINYFTYIYIATVVTTMANTEGEETYEESYLGTAEEVYE
jgi:hypothetical protein